MKQLFSFLVAAFLVLHSFAQTEGPKKTNLVLIKGVSFDDVVKYFLLHSYQLDQVNKEYQVIATKPFTSKGTSAEMTVQVLIKSDFVAEIAAIGAF
jgi:hypothetical protein